MNSNSITYNFKPIDYGFKIPTHYCRSRSGLDVVMRFEVETLDDALLRLYPALLSKPPDTKASRGWFSEILGVTIEISQPRARLSRSEMRGRVFSSLGEWLWYLTRDNRLDFIKKYIHRYENESDDGVTIYGGYGPRLFKQRGLNQIENIVSLLRERPTSRRAVIQIFNAEDIVGRHQEVPCTTTLQFLVRDERLHLIACLRSNDAYIGVPHDIFCFTMIQEIVARELDRDIGTYIHFAGSMHLYEGDRENAHNLINEGYQRRIEMPPMPSGTPWPSIETLLRAEARIRSGEKFDANEYGLAPYWSDLIRMLQIFFGGDPKEIERLKKAMSFQWYGLYISGRLTV